MTQFSSTPDASLGQVLTDACARLDAAAELTPEQVSQCNAFVDIIRQEIIAQIARAPITTVLLKQAEVPAIVAKFDSRYFQEKLLSDAMTVDRFCNAAMSKSIRRAVERSLGEFEKELSQVLGTPGRHFECFCRSGDALYPYFRFYCVIPESPISKADILRGVR